MPGRFEPSPAARYVLALIAAGGSVLLTLEFPPEALFRGYFYYPFIAVVLVAAQAGRAPAMLTGAAAAVGTVAVVFPVLERGIDAASVVQLGLRTVIFMLFSASVAAVIGSVRSALSREAEARKLDARRVQELNTERKLREEFVAVLTHDLRTPLATARIKGQLALKRGASEGPVAELLRSQMASIDRALRMTSDLLDAYRMVLGHGYPLSVAPTRLAPLLAETVSELEVFLDAPIAAEIADELEGHWDGAALRRVVENLIINAAKYGGRGSAVKLCARRDGSSAVLEVHNGGPAIDPRVLPTIFDQFFRTQPDGERRGWGVGLTAVRALVEAHGGNVSVRSADGEGTTFTVVLPLEASTAA